MSDERTSAPTARERAMAALNESALVGATLADPVRQRERALDLAVATNAVDAVAETPKMEES